MSTAFDEIEKKYLIEKYLISYSIGLKYPSNLKLRSNKLSALFAGNSKTSQDTLWGIEKEITNLAHLNFDNSDILIDTEFSEQSLFSKLKQHNYSILHIALHNQIGKTITDSQLFIRDNKTFSLTQFEQILRSSDYQLNLLTLAACDTALGDRYAVLGLAGLSLRTGTPNLIGSLWAVPDSSSFLAMKVFYESILKGDNIAQAFQKMQISQIRSNSAENIHPSKWGGYILIL
jgi:CHAT domain-containing protein